MASTNALIARDESAVSPDTGLPGAATGTGAGAGSDPTQGANPLMPQRNDLTMLNPAMAITGGITTGSANPLTPQTGAFTDYVAPTEKQGPGSGIRTALEQAYVPPPPPPPPPAPAPAAAAPPAAAGAQQAPNGQWYVPNPNGRGWMLMSDYNKMDPMQRTMEGYTSGDFGQAGPVPETPFDAPAGSYLNAQGQLMVPDGQGGFFLELAPARGPGQATNVTGQGTNTGMLGHN